MAGVIKAAAMALGIEADWNGTTMMRLLQKNFSNSTRTTKHEKFEDGLACLRTRLKTYYKNGHDANPDYKWSRIDRLTLKMLGKENPLMMNADVVQDLADLDTKILMTQRMILQSNGRITFKVFGRLDSRDFVKNMNIKVTRTMWNL